MAGQIAALPLSVLGLGLLAALPAAASPYFFSTGIQTDYGNRLDCGSQWQHGNRIPADDFILSASTAITSATFTGLLTGGASPADVRGVQVEIYRVFPTTRRTRPTAGCRRGPIHPQMSNSTTQS